MNEWVSKLWSIHTVKYYGAIKGNEVLIHATIMINVKIIMLSEESQVQKVTRCMISIYMKYLE